MILSDNQIKDINTWFEIAPPMGGKTQWVDGRSAKELARYITKDLPNVPKEMQQLLLSFVPEDSVFEWGAEYVTDFFSAGLGKGNGRNHDAVLFNDNFFVGIEGKADESFGTDLNGTAYNEGSSNKQKRIEGLTEMIFGGHPNNHRNIRYQLLTATAAILLEAKNRNLKEALFLVLVFKKDGKFDPIKVESNNEDIRRFLQETGAIHKGDYWEIPTHYGEMNGIKLYFAKMEIEI